MASSASAHAGAVAGSEPKIRSASRPTSSTTARSGTRSAFASRETPPCRVLGRQGILKLPFKLDFDEFEDDYPQIDNQRFYGFKKLSLKNNYDDQSPCARRWPRTSSQMPGWPCRTRRSTSCTSITETAPSTSASTRLSRKSTTPSSKPSSPAMMATSTSPRGSERPSSKVRSRRVLREEDQRRRERTGPTSSRCSTRCTTTRPRPIPRPGGRTSNRSSMSMAS